MTAIDQLEARLRTLEDAEAIRRLKARYLACCDQKNPQGMRDCFAPGPVHIDYGRIGVFEDRDQLVAIFEALGCHPHVVEMHHGVNPQIDVLDDTHARGTWGLHYQMIDTRERVITQLGATYEDAYRKVDGQWKISATRCVVTSTLVASYQDTVPGVRFAGIQPSAVLEDANE
ncbi:nuclear transport factor 2 family protein [Pseudomonas alkylphenolica]|uniref:nuclear transport factor 2 family protein n=1 Tax=Pseudomonas alkylphenolica TaxID=237609 RepID=UPI0018D6773B|nr:nuclear transport factor 2 family protein [Pseudomonas alkylphenolica]MBH3426320.1 nuclear transport factor 2 family protein [Pseudomonas alkylphenolica]